jgi:hypothetical protein
MLKKEMAEDAVWLDFALGTLQASTVAVVTITKEYCDWWSVRM